ncbi:hypothetical protein Pmani_013888 [Petrolisthes manimaculis]|uniref:Uncharacterized protein n=1 Tax=Petrolisthes manimaculis TaxID=1843537 RepID=A0AAE1PWL8_9EUCA|nr:hypothetical protein Pmani_013888 [Petrolisthes manimaculis]
MGTLGSCVARHYISLEAWSPATVLIILVLGALAVLYIFFNRRHITLKGRVLPGSSVVFRPETNIEIGPPSFMAPADGPNGVPLEGDVNMGDIEPKNHNLSNPMYDAMVSMEGRPTAPKIYMKCL